MIELTDDLAFQALRKTWQPVANSDALAIGDLIHYKLLNVDLVIARFETGLLAADQACPHKGMRLELGCIEKGELQCPYHGWRFNQQGECTKIPSLENPPCERLQSAHLNNYDVEERYGMIWVKLDKDEITPLPNIPEFENSDWHYLVAEPMFFDAGFRREIENYLDMTHFAFAHKNSLGLAAKEIMPEMDIVETADGYEMNAPFPALQNPDEIPGKLQEAHHRKQHGYMPNFTTIRQSFHDGDERVLVHIPSPNTEESCTVFWALAISPDFDGPAPEKQIEFAINVLNEDRLMCENQRPKEVPLKPSRSGWGLLVTPGDNLSVTFQKRFRDFLIEHHESLS
ncbi:MAG: Rieske 2Fe-2S domain-containing protein [Lentisphaeria bacterium]|nr:Rieske 2Fe-2S domain-containing protein [Lentisphaeria bacterium]NQZ67116.1 Rieske 2Fe-2S domain-containing protein [Lentisphaeria bacterium]